MTVTPEMRTAVFLRDKGICGICGEPVTLVNYHVDHIVQRAEGGPDTLDNLRCTHDKCNLGRPRIRRPMEPRTAQNTNHAPLPKVTQPQLTIDPQRLEQFVDIFLGLPPEDQRKLTRDLTGIAA